jgi:voltage-gated potassium channel
MRIKDKLCHLVEDTDTKAGRIFDLSVMALIIYSIITLTIETLPGIGDAAKKFLRYSEIIVTVLFSFEYGLRVYISKKKTDYVFSFWGFIDIVAIAPFYLTLILGFGAIDLRAVRAFRLLRILRLLKIGRYSKAVNRFYRAFQIAREEMVLYVFLTLILLYVSATGIYYFENQAQPEVFKSIIHSLWWALATLTTVGYGDVYPITFGGRVFTFFVLMIGLGIVAVPAGLLASALSQARQEEREGK